MPYSNLETGPTGFVYTRCDHKAVQCSVLEAALRQHEEVLDCAAYAKIIPHFGEVPAAWVVLLKEPSHKSEVSKLRRSTRLEL